MGAYTMDEIKGDFRVVAEGDMSGSILEMQDVAIKVLENDPDNMLRDMAISSLLQAAGFIAMLREKDSSEERSQR